MQQGTITLQQAIKRMRELSLINVLFSMSFYTYNASKDTSNGLKHVSKALLRKGMSYSDKADLLLAYIDLDNEDAPRHLYIPLLMTFNNYNVTA